LYLDTTNKMNIKVSFVTRDIDGGGNNSIQPVFVLYRIGTSGNFSLVFFDSDVTHGPFDPNVPFGIPEFTTNPMPTLPPDADNASHVEVLLATGNAAGNDEFVGIDNISVTGDVFVTRTPTPTITSTPTFTNTPAANTPTFTATSTLTPTETLTRTFT